MNIMARDRLALGVFTTDERLIIRTWDAWLSRATPIDATQALGRPLLEIIPDLPARGLMPIFEDVLARGTVLVLAPALHRYLVRCSPIEHSTIFEHMQQHVTIGPLRDDGQVAGVVVTIEDVTARVEGERWLAGRYGKPSPAGAMSMRDGMQPSRDDIASLARRLVQPDRGARRTAVTSLAEHSRDIVDAVVGTLRRQDPDFGRLGSILDLLAISEVDIVQPLIWCLKDRDTYLRIQAARLLGQQMDRRAIGPLIAGLADPDVNVRYHAIGSLGQLRATEAWDALAMIAEQRNELLHPAAVEALAALGDDEVAGTESSTGAG
jgi:hypothetical protein